MKKALVTLCAILALCLVLAGCGPIEGVGRLRTSNNNTSLDGTWFFTIDVPADPSEGSPAYSYLASKMVISGTSVTSWYTTEEYAIEAATYAGLAECNETIFASYLLLYNLDEDLPLGPEPLPEFSDESDSGTVTVNGRNVSFSFGGSTFSGTVSRDGKTVTVHGMVDNEPVTFTYVKQTDYTETPLEGVWCGYEEKIVFFGNQFQVHPLEEGSSTDFCPLSTMCGTFSVSGNSFTLTDSGTSISGTIDSSCITLLGGFEYIPLADYLEQLGNSGNGQDDDAFNADGALDGTWYGTPAEDEASGSSDYEGFDVLKLVIDGEDITLYTITEDCQSAIADWNYEFHPSYHDPSQRPETEWDEGSSVVVEDIMGYTWLTAENDTEFTITSDDDWETIQTGFVWPFGEVVFSKTSSESTTPENTDPELDATIDGYYVETGIINGKPVNMYTLVIEGDTMKVYAFMPGNGAGIVDMLDGAQQVLNSTKTITRHENELAFDVVITEGNNPVTYTLTTTESGIFLSSPDESFEKVLPGTTGVGQMQQDYYTKGLNSAAIMTIGSQKRYTFQFTDIQFSPLGTTQTENGIVVNGIRYEDPDELFLNAEDVTFTLTITDTAVVISNVQNWLEGYADPAGTYDRYVHTGPWPVAPAN